jgi:hypothetical protein
MPAANKRKAKAKPIEPVAIPSIIDACHDEALFKSWFKHPETWAAWFVFLKTLFGLPLDDVELELFRQCTGRTAPSPTGYVEASLICGRRGGKSLILALIAAYLAVFRDYRPFLTAGERGTIMIIAADRKQAQSIFRYLKGLLGVPLLAGLIERETAEVLELSNQVSIEIQTASFRTLRGRTVVASLNDETAFWRSDDGAASPDVEIYAALRPAMATIPGAMLLSGSSPYARRGVLYDDFRRHYGRDDSQTLVWKAPTRVMNPSVPQSIIDEAMERDAASAAAEYLAEFRSDVQAFLSPEAVDAVIAAGVFELPPMLGTDYVSFADPSGGSADSMTLAIAHREGDRAVLDVIREAKPPFSPESVVSEFAALLKRYQIKTVTGDRYAGEWPRERFQAHGITYQCSDKVKSDLYRDLLPLINSGQVELLDHPKLTAQLCSLERRTARGGRDSIDHPPSAHDDVANAVAGAMTLATTVAKYQGLMFA